MLMKFAGSLRPAFRSIPCRSCVHAAGISSIRTEVTDPRLHGEQHVGRFYRIPPDIFDGLFQLAGYTERRRKMLDVLADPSIMVRKPALEIIKLLNKTNYNKPVNRFVICELLVRSMFYSITL